FLKFSKDRTDGKYQDENIRPADVVWYIKLSELLSDSDERSSPFIDNNALTADPTAVLRTADKKPDCSKDLEHCSSDITIKKAKTYWYRNPLNRVHGLSGDPGRHGEPWGEVMSKRNVGLYGHVVPVKVVDPLDFRQAHVPSNADQGQIYYKIEYWQFFGVNFANQSLGAADHEGDWTTVQLLCEPGTDKIISVFHYAHGFEFRFDMSATKSTALLNDGGIKEFKGPNYGKDVAFGGADPGGQAVALP